MTSLTEVYEAKGASLRQLYLGTGLFLVGAVMSVVAIVVATTSVLEPMGVGLYASREIAGVLAGLGVPAAFVGIFIVLPASFYQRVTAAVGATIAVFGVLLFVQAYPEHWITATPNHSTFPVAVVYFAGAITTFWALFNAVVNFKVRNDPGGTVTLQRIIERARAESSRSTGSTPSSSGLGSVGIGGGIDRNPVETPPASDGGATDTDIRTPTPADDAEMLPNQSDLDAADSNPDRYCGNCADFDYVRTDDGFSPYCGYYDEVMDDMNPCEHWEPNA